jgi:hypothetical protein
VAPAGVKAEVDGQPVAISAGTIELRGALGSTHRVVLRLAGQQLLRDVAITESGALPDKLELGSPLGRARVSNASAGTSTKSVAGAAPPATAATPPAVASKPAGSAKSNGASLDRTFE